MVRAAGQMKNDKCCLSPVGFSDPVKMCGGETRKAGRDAVALSASSPLTVSKLPAVWLPTGLANVCYLHFAGLIYAISFSKMDSTFAWSLQIILSLLDLIHSCMLSNYPLQSNTIFFLRKENCKIYILQYFTKLSKILPCTIFQN